MDEKKKRIVGNVIYLITLAAVCVFAWLDTSPYRAAVEHVEKDPSFLAQLKGTTAAITSDIDAAYGCKNLHRLNPKTQLSEDTTEERSCFITKMPSAKTAKGAYVFVMSAFPLFRDHAADKDLRVAALAAIANGRADLLAQKSWYYDAMETLAEAHDRSKLYLLRDGSNGSGERLFDHDIQMLDDAEVLVLLPDVAEKRLNWRLQAYAGKA